MIRIPVVFIFLLWIIDCHGQGAASNTPLILSVISEQNGLSDDHVRCVLKDQNNFIWVGTSDGLNLVDGSTIKIFRHKEGDSTSLPGSDIASLTEDNKNNLIYVGTNKGLGWYDQNKKSFNAAIPDESPYGVSMFFQQMALVGDKLWCATDGGLLLFDPQTRKFTPYYNNSTEQESEPRYNNKLTGMVAGGNGLLWICSNDGLWSFDTRSKKYTKIIHRNNDPFYHPLCLCAYVDHDKNVWAGFWNTGLKKYDTHTGKLINIENKAHAEHTVSSITEIKQQDGHYLLWLNGNLLALDEKRNEYFHFQQSQSEKTLPVLNPVFQSPDGWVWLGSNNGLFIYNPQRQLFRHFPFSSSITSQSISFLNYKNALLVGAEGKDFLKLKDNNGNVLTDYSKAGNNSTLLYLKETNPGEFWIGTSSGVLHTNLLLRNTKWFSHNDQASHSIPRNFVPCLLVDSKKNLWVFPWREGIWQMDQQTGQCKKLLDGFIREVNGVKKLLIGDAAEDANGNIWMSDLDEGIVLYNVATRQFSKPFEKELGPRYATSRIFIRNKTVYSFVSDGLIKWNIDSMVVHKIALPAEMNKGLNDMYPDNSGNWWLASRNGLIVYREEQNSFSRYTIADGLIQNDINGTLYCAADSTMWIGTPNYLISFNPALLIQSSVSRKMITMTEILANNKTINLDTSHSFTLNYRDNNIVIRWALPDYGNPLRNQYYVKLNGIDEDWRYIGNTGEVQYANLSPGHYTIQLKAATANGVDAESISTLVFVINPPFWKTAWFIVMASLLLISAFIIVVRYISQRNLKEKLLRLEKEQAIERERNRISRDMHDDLGSGLTKIAILSEVVKKQMHEPEKARQQLENISQSSRELVDNLQDIIWVLNPKNDTLESLAAYIREYALKFFEPFAIEVRFSYPEKFSVIKLSEETRRNIFLVIKESFNNIAKHAWCNQVMITIIQNTGNIQLIISDDGKGFDTNNVKPFSNGLSNMKNRVEQINGTYNIESELGKGTVTRIRITL